MAANAPQVDDRRYRELLDETLARVPVHTPEWTNFNKSDPGVTVVELFAFLTENILYRANQMPDRNRRKFLQLLGIPLRPASAARGLVTIRNEKGALQAVTLGAGFEVRAGEVPFRTEMGLDVLPIDARVYCKRKVDSASRELQEYYKLLYSSYGRTMPTDPELYETVPLDPQAASAIDLGRDTVDRSLWIGLFSRKGEAPADARKAIEGRTLTLGVVPAVDEATVRLTPAGKANLQDESTLVFDLPSVPDDGKVQKAGDAEPAPAYERMTPRGNVDLLSHPGVVQLTLPAAAKLTVWRDLDPLESGVGDLPPAIDDTQLAERLVTWIRMSCTAAGRILWAGANAVPVTQRARVVGEPLADGTGLPDQGRRLSKAPVLEDSASIDVVYAGRTDARPWTVIDDLLAAGAEIVTEDLRNPPGRERKDSASANVFALDAVSGEVRFGDGLHGRRPPDGAKLWASYDYSVGAAGNVGPGAIASGPMLPSGFVVANPVRTWGGADAETEREGEKQIRRHLQHRDRLVTAADFEAIAYRAPGVDVGRVEVLPAFHPSLGANQPGGAPGVVTLMVIPAHDVKQPDAPVPDRLFLDTLCRYLDPRRLVTTELVLCAPAYKGIWVSIGIDVVAGRSIAEVVDAVKRHIKEFLAPVREAGLQDSTDVLTAPQRAAADRGWPLRTAVSSRVLLAEAARVPGVSAVSEVLIAEGDKATQASVDMRGLELPRLLGLSVVVGEPEPIAALRGQPAAPQAPARRRLPVPFVPEEC